MNTVHIHNNLCKLDILKLKSNLLEQCNMYIQELYQYYTLMTNYEYESMIDS